MKINYPIKYTAMPIIEQIGWTQGWHELEREYEIICYIVSKCYLMGELTKYKENGQRKKEYEVVFPYQPSEFGRWKRTTPTQDGVKVDLVFNSYEEALIYTTNKNKELCENTWKNLPITKDIMEKIHKKEEEFNIKLLKYKELEEQILLLTTDIQPEKHKKLNNTIKIINNKASILSCSIYEVLNFFNYENYLVYNISEEQYNSLQKSIYEEKNEDTKEILKKATGLLIHKSKNNIIKILTNEEQGAYYLQNNSINYGDKLEKVTLEDFANIDKETLIFLTTETIEDILISYKKHPDIDLDNKDRVLKKVKTLQKTKI